jgi:Na+-transporting NADH:ubiquinone oxidoreductase subunit NqrD
MKIINKIINFIRENEKNLLFCILASMLASNGLVNDSANSVIGSMLVSPISNLLITMIHNIHTNKNVDILGISFLAMTYILIGLIVGFFTYLFVYKLSGNKFILNKQIMSRADLNIIDYVNAFLYAFICGIAFYLAYSTTLKKHNITSLVGIGIGSSLLPPIVNAGILLGASIDNIGYKENNNSELEENNINALQYSGKSLLLFSVNIIGLFVGCFLTIKIHRWHLGNNDKKKLAALCYKHIMEGQEKVCDRKGKI